MRVLFAVAILLALSFAGCSDKKGGSHDHETYDCPDGTKIDAEDIPGHDNDSFEFDPDIHCETGTGPPGPPPTTNSTPNVPPVLVIKVFDAPGGNETNVTMMGNSLTFSAEGSSDSDGSLAGIAITVDDGNSTRTQSLYVNGQFVPATFLLDRPGVVNVTAAAVDNRAGFAINQTRVYVNQEFPAEGRLLTGSHPTATAQACAEHPINGEAGAAENMVRYKRTFEAGWGAQWAEATINLPAGRQVAAAFCSPIPEGGSAGTAMSAGQTLPSSPSSSATTHRIETSPDAVFDVMSTNYFVNIINRVPNPPAQTETTISVIVHYEPRPAAAA